MNSTDAGETITANTESEADSPSEQSRATKHLDVNIRTDGVVNCDLEINLECKHCDSRKSFANLVEFLCHVIQAHDEKFLYRCNICCGNFRSSKVLGHLRDHVEENSITLSGISKQAEQKFKREVASGINDYDLDSYPGEQAEDIIEHGTSANNIRKNLRRKTKQLLKYESISHDTQDSVHAAVSSGADDEVKISRKIKLGKSSKFGTSKKFVCSICYGNFNTSSELGHHFQTHEECLTCLVCGQTFTLKSRLKKHMWSRHLNNQQFGGVKRPKKTEKSATRHLCAVCGKVFSLRSRLTKHFRIHTGEKPYKCRHCGKSFSLGSNLQRHERIHTGERPFLCTTCGKSFNHLTSFKTHTLAHKGIRPPKSTKKFNCDFCNKDYSTRGSLRIHLRLHTNDCPFKCTECPKSFTKKIALTRHMMDHTGNRPYKCKYCEKAFKQLTSVDIHMRTHTGDKPFACNTCGKSFSNRANLHRHDDTHKGLRRYNCGFCNKDFTQRSTLKDHLNIHTGARPYQCSHCSGAFANQSTYSKHVSKHLNKSDV